MSFSTSEKLTEWSDKLRDKSFNLDDLLIEILRFGAEVEREMCCAQISQCHLISPEDRDKIATYLYETRRSSQSRPCSTQEPAKPASDAPLLLH